MKKDGAESFGFLLHDAARLLRRRFEARGSEMGLSSAQWRLLVRLFREGEARQARLAELMEIEPISVSRLVDRMVQAGWVERRPDPRDRRVKIVAPSAAALQALSDIRAVADDIYDEAMAGLDAQARAALMAGLAAVVRNLSAGDPDCTGEQDDTGK